MKKIENIISGKNNTATKMNDWKKCILCDVIMRNVEVEAHIGSEPHIQLLLTDYSGVPKYVFSCGRPSVTQTVDLPRMSRPPAADEIIRAYEFALEEERKYIHTCDFVNLDTLATILSDDFDCLGRDSIMPGNSAAGRTYCANSKPLGGYEKRKLEKIAANYKNIDIEQDRIKQAYIDALERCESKTKTEEIHSDADWVIEISDDESTYDTDTDDE